MKKLILISIVLSFVLVLNAQIVKIQPKFEIGKENYFLGSYKVIEGDIEYKVITVQRIKVLNSDQDGFTMETEIVKMVMDYNRWAYDTDLAETIWKARLNNVYKFKTNIDGKILKLLNADEVMKKGKDNLGSTWDVAFWGKYPERFKDANSQMTLWNIVYSGLTEEGFVNWMNREPSLFSLNGKEFKNKQQYHYNDNSGLKMLRTIESLSFDEMHYLIINIKDKLDMSQEERKQLLYNQLKEAYPDEINKININEIYKASGLETYKKDMSFDCVLDSSFWPIKYEHLDVGDKYLVRCTYLGLSDEEVHEVLGK
jgi:hypothetical protein